MKEGKKEGEWNISEVLGNAFIINVMEKDLRKNLSHKVGWS